VLAAAVLLAGCGSGPAPQPPAPTPAPPPAATPAPDGTPVSAAELGPSWHDGCPVGPGELRRVEVDHLGYDGKIHRGALIVHRSLVPQVRQIFAELLAVKYPIERIRTVERYPNAEDELSMRDNNTSAFNCRGIPGSDSWSQHAYGLAIDINPLVNPYISKSGRLEPATAAEYVDRNRRHPGTLTGGDDAVRAFTDRGWSWGGDWTDPKDYQHFESPRR